MAPDVTGVQLMIRGTPVRTEMAGIGLEVLLDGNHLQDGNVVTTGLHLLHLSGLAIKVPGGLLLLPGLVPVTSPLLLTGPNTVNIKAHVPRNSTVMEPDTMDGIMTTKVTLVTMLVTLRVGDRKSVV